MEAGGAIIIFVRHPELGKVKTRLAAAIGDEKALAVYTFLLQHTFHLIKDLSTPVYIYYSDAVIEDDLWKGDHIIKKRQTGKDLGERMAKAFQEVFSMGHAKAIIIGSDCYDLSVELIDQAFALLTKTGTVIGPAKDGGYYLLGMKAPFKNIFENIAWSTSTVFSETLEKINQNKYSVSILPVLTDVDTEEDIRFSY